MDIGDTFKIDNQEYTVIDVLKKKHYEQDVLLCSTKRYKECFQRFDLEGGQAHERVKIGPTFNFKW